MIERAPDSDNRPRAPFHVAAIMDGNGRYATARGRTRSDGHRAGATAARRIVEAAPDMGVDILTLFALSSENWNRPPAEVRFLLQLLRRFLRLECRRCVERGVRLSVIGSRRRLPARLVAMVDHVESATSAGRRMQLRVAIDYSSRDAILEAAARWAASGEPAPTREGFARALGATGALASPAPEVDLLIRTGGEKRLSDFLLWESAYAELYFTDTMWPEFAPAELERAIADYRRRERRFGLVPRSDPA